jgi:hypothetical protein
VSQGYGRGGERDESQVVGGGLGSPVIGGLRVASEEMVVDDHALGRLCPFEGIDPAPVRLRPVATAVVQTAAQDEFPQTIPASLEIFTRIITGATQIADGFFFRCSAQPAAS